MLRCLGAIAPHARIRAHVVPRPRPPARERDGKDAQDGSDGKDPVHTGPLAPCRPARMAWADLPARAVALDVLQCACGGRLPAVAIIQDPTVIQAVAASLTSSVRLAARRRGGSTGPPGRRRRHGFTDTNVDASVHVDCSWPPGDARIRRGHGVQGVAVCPPPATGPARRQPSPSGTTCDRRRPGS